jgi:cyclic pyranopterin phosphate synthase
MSDELTHLNEAGEANMVDVGDKAQTARRAVAIGRVYMNDEARRAVESGGLEKGEALSVARVAGIMGAKKTSELIPLCHQIALDKVGVQFEFVEEPSSIAIRAEARCHGQTGVEMEALTGVSVAALAIYDMCKAIDRAMTIGEVRLAHKSGGRSGTFDNPDNIDWST